MSALHQQFGNAFVQAVVVSVQGSRTPAPSGEKSVSSHATAAKPAIDASTQNAPPLSAKEASDVLYVAMQILAGHGKPAVDGFEGTAKTSRYKADLEKLRLAQSAMNPAKAEADNNAERHQLSAADRSRLFGEARTDLMPLVELCKSDEGIARWNTEQLVPRFDELARDLAFDVANERVKNSVLLGSGEAVEMPADSDPHEQGRVLHLELPKLLAAIKAVSEQLVRLKDHAIEHEAQQMLQSGTHGKKYGSLAELGNALMLADAWLTLTDEEFKEHLSEVHGVINGLSTYSELVKAVMELAVGGAGAVCSIGSLIARAAGDSALAATCSGAARTIAIGKFGTAIATIEIAHGIFVLLDKTATPEKKLSAAGDVATGVAWLGGKKLIGAEFGAAASSAVLGGYIELKWAITTYSESVIGWDTGILRDAYSTLEMYGERIPALAEDVAKAHALVAQEPDAEKKEALTRVESVAVHVLGTTLDSLIADCGPQGMDWNALEGARSTKPGSVQILQDWFAPLQAFRGARTPEGVMNGAASAMKRIAWARTHARDVLAAAANGRDIVDLQRAANEQEDDKSDRHE